MLHSEHFSLKQLIYLPSKMFGGIVIIPKNIIKKAVNRNKLRRQIRNIMQDSGIHYIIYVKKGANQLTYSQIRDELTKLYRQ